MNEAEHDHCPYGCEHPQPFTDERGQDYCGACWYEDKELVKMVPCDPGHCE